VEVAFAAGESRVLRDAAAGDPEAVRRVLDQTSAVVYGFVLARLAGDEETAADVVQETYLQAMRSAGSFRAEAALSTWLCAIARHVLARHYARERREERVRSGLVAVGQAEPVSGGEIDAAESRQQLMAALSRLPVVHRQVLVLKYLDGRSVEEIAVDLGRNRVQIQSLLQRAREGLRRELEGGDG
jgi:RNA polymerase sigma-70 factor (ECF subfamily)